MAKYKGDPRWLTSRFPGTCSKCGASVKVGDQVFYFPNGNSVMCAAPACGKAASSEFDSAAFDEAQATGCY